MTDAKVYRGMTAGLDTEVVRLSDYEAMQAELLEDKRCLLFTLESLMEELKAAQEQLQVRGELILKAREFRRLECGGDGCKGCIYCWDLEGTEGEREG